MATLPGAIKFFDDAAHFEGERAETRGRHRSEAVG